MLLSRTEPTLGAGKSAVSIKQPIIGRDNLCIPGRTAEPTISIEHLEAALKDEDIERFRPLLPIGYEATAAAYQTAVKQITANTLSTHYIEGIQFFQDEFVPFLKNSLKELSGWDLQDYVAYAAGSDVDFMTHIIDAVEQPVCLYPGDWYGFLVGASRQENIKWDINSKGAMACLCIPSVRNGHLTQEMFEFLERADTCLLNINLYPTLPESERHAIAASLNPILPKSILSVSFSRGFGLTASQLGVILIHKNHPLRKRFDTQWRWFSYYFNAIATQAYMALDLTELKREDKKRRQWVQNWLHERELPIVESGSYYIKSFRPQGSIPERLMPLVREDILRLCFKPPEN